MATAQMCVEPPPLGGVEAFVPIGSIEGEQPCQLTIDGVVWQREFRTGGVPPEGFCFVLKRETTLEFHALFLGPAFAPGLDFSDDDFIHVVAAGIQTGDIGTQINYEWQTMDVQAENVFLDNGEPLANGIIDLTSGPEPPPGFIFRAPDGVLIFPGLSGQPTAWETVTPQGIHIALQNWGNIEMFVPEPVAATMLGTGTILLAVLGKLR